MDEMTVPTPGPELSRCSWSGAAPEFLAYHDTERGFPVGDDRRLFEKLCLEGFQSGLSWRTILTKRENFRAAFAGFDIPSLARFTARDVERLLQDAGIVRHRGKIEATIDNARRAEELLEREGSLAAFVRRHEPAPTELSEPQTVSTSAASVALSKDLKRKGWAFVGPTTTFAFMQAMGLINDHAVKCAIRLEAERQRTAFTRSGRSGNGVTGDHSAPAPAPKAL
ncbi:DNA-3-methyladenine glycosylase I [Streptosporangium carneum]|nr:DNA-3-methyladenine glycosylase I [Streptosporangium carneum]